MEEFPQRLTGRCVLPERGLFFSLSVLWALLFWRCFFFEQSPPPLSMICCTFSGVPSRSLPSSAALATPCPLPLATSDNFDESFFLSLFPLVRFPFFASYFPLVTALAFLSKGKENSLESSSGLPSPSWVFVVNFRSPGRFSFDLFRSLLLELS